MTSTTIKSALLAALFAIGTAHASTITFDEFVPSDTNFLTSGSTFTTNGYRFDVTEGTAWFLNRPPLSGYATNGTTSLDLGGTITLTSAANHLFSVSSLDLATVAALETSTVRFTGTDANGISTTHSYSMNGATSPTPFGLTTTPLAGFDNLVSFEMELVFNQAATTWFSLVDNIVIDDAATSVPEPATWAMLGLGLAMLAGRARRTSR